jgi:hypothetical protein
MLVRKPGNTGFTSDSTAAPVGKNHCLLSQQESLERTGDDARNPSWQWLINAYRCA